MTGLGWVFCRTDRDLGGGYQRNYSRITGSARRYAPLRSTAGHPQRRHVRIHEVSNAPWIDEGRATSRQSGACQATSALVSRVQRG